MNFKSWKDAEAEFYKSHVALTDDSDSEETRIMNWIEDNEHEVDE